MVTYTRHRETALTVIAIVAFVFVALHITGAVIGPATTNTNTNETPPPREHTREHRGATFWDYMIVHELFSSGSSNKDEDDNPNALAVILSILIFIVLILTLWFVWPVAARFVFAHFWGSLVVCVVSCAAMYAYAVYKDVEVENGWRDAEIRRLQQAEKRRALKGCNLETCMCDDCYHERTGDYLH